MAPNLPTLYFDDKVERDGSTLAVFPVEILQNVTGYFDWGELARMSAVQTSWTTVMEDAAEQGGHDSQWELAQALVEGTHGLQRHPERAIALLEELAAVEIQTTVNRESETTNMFVRHNVTPFAPAMKRLAECHLKGHGVEQNSSIGIRWLEAAFEHGQDSDAAHKLALIYEYGEHSVVIDVFKAAEWFRKAAEAGHIEAMAEYAMCCELGCGVEQNDEEALEFYMMAANAGHTSAKFSVGEAFEEARGVPQSDTDACLWYFKAAVEGDEDSKKALRRLHDIARIVLPGLADILDE